jgi:Protein of unknown function (DUF3047)
MPVFLLSDGVRCEAADHRAQGCSRRHFARLSLGLGGAVLLSACSSLNRPVQPLPRALLPFSDQPATGDLPLGWEPYVIRRNLKRTQYRTVEHDGQTVLHARAEAAALGLQTQVHVNPRETPWFSWSWRVDTVHTQATVTDDDAEDTPARIVLAFEGDVSKLPLRERIFFEQVELFTGNKLPYATLAYAWDGQAAVGQVVPYVRSKRLQNYVVESGTASAGTWRHYERNVLEDFKQVFGEDPPGIIRSVGVLTDSDDLRNTAEAWYGDMRFSAQACCQAHGAQTHCQP